MPLTFFDLQGGRNESPTRSWVGTPQGPFRFGDTFQEALGLPWTRHHGYHAIFGACTRGGKENATRIHPRHVDMDQGW